MSYYSESSQRTKHDGDICVTWGLIATMTWGLITTMADYLLNRQNPATQIYGLWSDFPGLVAVNQNTTCSPIFVQSKVSSG